jgi:hypothetical protein
LLLLIGGGLLVALGAAVVAAHVTAWVVDETVIEQSAVHYTSGLPHSLFHDLDARATSRLYSLVLSIAFHFADGAQAIRADHVLSAVLFTSTAAPVYLMARVLLRSQWAAAVAALMSVAVPWLAISSALFEENLAYPLFWWTVLACCNAIWRARARNDALALLAIAVLIVTRVEMASLFVGYVIAIAAVCLWRADGSGGKLRRVGSAAREALHAYPFAVVVAVIGGGAVIYARFFTSYLEHLLGTYANVIYRSSLPPNVTEAMLVQLIALGLGVGLIPAIVSIPWYARRMSKPQLDRRGVYLLTTGVLLAVFALGTAFAQDGYLGVFTEERYFFYVIPVFWLGTFAALEDQRLRPTDLLISAAVLAALFGAMPLLDPFTNSTAFLAPVETVVPHVLERYIPKIGLRGLTNQDALVLVALVAGIVTAILWRRWRTVRAVWTVGAAAALQLVIAGYAFAVIDGKIAGTPGRTDGSVTALGWVDSHARGADVTWLDNEPLETNPAGGNPPNAERMRNALFWNSHLRSWALLPALGLPPPEWPMTVLNHTENLIVAPGSGTIGPQRATARIHEVVGTTNSPFLQVAGVTRALSPEGLLTLTAVSPPMRATWLALGLAGEGQVIAGHPVQLYAFAPAAAAATGQAEAVTLTVVPPPAPTPAAPAPGSATPPSGTPAAPSASPTARAQAPSLLVRLGHAGRSLPLPPGAAARQVKLLVCFPAGHGVAAGSLQLRPAPSSPAGAAVKLLTVSLVPLPSGAAGCARA